MPAELVVILDDREAPPEAVISALGRIRFGEILRRRRRLIEELREACADADDVVHVQDAAAAETLAMRVDDAGDEVRWLRLPLAIPPLDMTALGALLLKARFALETMFASRIFGDEAPMVLASRDAAALLRAAGTRERHALLLEAAASAPAIADQVGFVDLREPRALMRFLAGATEARTFNAVSTEGGILRKSSADHEKMRAEHDFFHLAPPAMKRFLMPTFDFARNAAGAGYAMEHLNVADVALQFIHGAFSPADFGRLLDQFFAYLDAREAGPIDRNATLALGRAQILEKLDRRLADLAASAEGRRLDALLETAGAMGGLEALRRRAGPLIEAGLARDRSDRPVLSHGDPCFSNILFDRRLGMMRLVDPRGARDREGAMMHPLYDLAKFSHSVCGGYDFVNSELFSVRIDGALQLRLELDGGGPPDWARAGFAARLKAEDRDIRAVRAVELSLFLSMLPLHRDHPRKLVGFVLIAMGIIEELEEGA